MDEDRVPILRTERRRLVTLYGGERTGVVRLKSEVLLTYVDMSRVREEVLPLVPRIVLSRHENDSP